MDNLAISRQLLEAAHDLEKKQGNLFRVRAYRRAAEVIGGLDRPVQDLLAAKGRKGLRDLPGIGSSLSIKIETLVHGGDVANMKDEALVAV